jgi:hypothetical protein
MGVATKSHLNLSVDQHPFTLPETDQRGKLFLYLFTVW